MRDNDGRRLDHATLEAIRLQAVLQVEQGSPPAQVAAALGLNRSTVFGWVARYRDGGVEALRARQVPGRPTKLSTEAMCRLSELVGTDPRRLRFECGLWTRAMVRVLVAREFGVVLSVASVGRILRSLGLWSPQSPPLTHARGEAAQGEDAAAGWWRTENYQKIRAEAAATGATVFFLHETGVRSQYRTAAAPANLVSAVSVQGSLRFAVYESGFGANVFIDFCNRLRHDAPGPAILVVGGHPTYRSDAVGAFVAATQGWLRMYELL